MACPPPLDRLGVARSHHLLSSARPVPYLHPYPSRASRAAGCTRTVQPSALRKTISSQGIAAFFCNGGILWDTTGWKLVFQKLCCTLPNSNCKAVFFIFSVHSCYQGVGGLRWDGSWSLVVHRLEDGRRQPYAWLKSLQASGRIPRVSRACIHTRKQVFLLNPTAAQKRRRPQVHVAFLTQQQA